MEADTAFRTPDELCPCIMSETKESAGSRSSLLSASLSGPSSATASSGGLPHSSRSSTTSKHSQDASTMLHNRPRSDSSPLRRQKSAQAERSQQLVTGAASADGGKASSNAPSQLQRCLVGPRLASARSMQLILGPGSFNVRPQQQQQHPAGRHSGGSHLTRKSYQAALSTLGDEEDGSDVEADGGGRLRGSARDSSASWSGKPQPAATIHQPGQHRWSDSDGLAVAPKRQQQQLQQLPGACFEVKGAAAVTKIKLVTPASGAKGVSAGAADLSFSALRSSVISLSCDGLPPSSPHLPAGRRYQELPPIASDLLRASSCVAVPQQARSSRLRPSSDCVPMASGL